MANMIIERKNETATLVMSKICAVLSIFANIFCIYQFSIAGISRIFGTVVNIPKAIQIILNLLLMRSIYYRGVCSAILVLIYCIFQIIMIKWLIKSITAMFKILDAKVLNDSLKRLTNTLGKCVGANFFLTVTFCFICVMVSDYKFGVEMYAIITIWVLVMLFTRLVAALEENYTWRTIITKTLYDSIVIIAFLFAMFLSKYPVVDRLVYAAKGVIASPINAILSMLFPILYFILMIAALKAVDYVLSQYFILQDEAMQKSARNILYISLSIGVASLVLFIWNGKTATLSFNDLLLIIRPCFSLILASLSAMIISMVPTDYLKTNKFNEKNTMLFSIDEKGVLYIKDGVTKIRAFAFENRTDITETHIPSSVTFIEEGAFAGCTRIKKIHCPHDELPINWSPSWSDGCQAKIIWKKENQ